MPWGGHGRATTNTQVSKLPKGPFRGLFSVPHRVSPPARGQPDAEEEQAAPCPTANPPGVGSLPGGGMEKQLWGPESLTTGLEQPAWPTWPSWARTGPEAPLSLAWASS